VGFIFSVAQLILYAIYYKSTQQIMEARRADQVSMSP
jgi:solute carrier family 50 protein (sugar transporter)